MGKFIDINQPRRYWAISLLASLLIHAAILGLFYPFFHAWIATVAAVFDPDWLGQRGGQKWAEEIALTAEPGGRFGSENKALQTDGTALRVEIIEMPQQGFDPSAKHKTEQDSASAKNNAADLGERVQESESSPSDHAQPSAPAQAKAQAAKGRARASKIGRDAGGQDGIGGSDKKAAGQFMSGKDMKRALAGWTLVGTNGFADGSIGRRDDKRRLAVNWRVYYRRDGYLQARFSKQSARTPHGDIALREFWSPGRWWVKKNWLCQSIEKWFYGGEACFEVRRKNKEMALYYASCWGVARCYEGRLGPRGFIVEGKKLD